MAKKATADSAPKKAATKKADAFKPLTKTQIIQALSDKSGITRKDVDAVLAGLSALIGEELAKGSNASFTLPGLIKIEKQHIDAKPAQKHVPDPFHPGQFTDRPAKDAYDKIKVKALKALKDMGL